RPVAVEVARTNNAPICAGEWPHGAGEKPMRADSIDKTADYLALVVDSIGHRALGGQRVVNCRVNSAAIEETVVDRAGIHVIADDLAGIVDSVGESALDRERIVKGCKITAAVQEAVGVGAVVEIADDLPGIVDAVRLGSALS